MAHSPTKVMVVSNKVLTTYSEWSGESKVFRALPTLAIIINELLEHQEKLEEKLKSKDFILEQIAFWKSQETQLENDLKKLQDQDTSQLIKKDENIE